MNQFWLSVKDVFTNIRLRSYVKQPGQNPNLMISTKSQNMGQLSEIDVSDLTIQDEMILKTNFYMRLEIVARGRYIYERNLFDNQSGIMQNKPQTVLNTTNFPIHQSIFSNNLRMVSKLLKNEVLGVFYSEKNQLDSCGNTPLMLAVKLGNLDAVKVLSDMYTCPKLRPL